MNLYQEIILEHSKRRHHAGLRDPFNTQVHHINPTGGDGVVQVLAPPDGETLDG